MIEPEGGRAASAEEEERSWCRAWRAPCSAPVLEEVAVHWTLEPIDAATPEESA